MSDAERDIRTALTAVWTKPSPGLVRALREQGYLLLARTGEAQWATHIETRKVIRIEGVRE